MRPPATVAALCVCLLAAGFSLVAEAAALKPTHVEIESIGKTQETQFKGLSAFCLNNQGNLLACDGKGRLIKVLTPQGKRLAEWKMPFGPLRIRVAADNTIYVGGNGVLAKLSKDGKVLRTVKSDGSNFPRSRSSGIAVSDKYVFASFGRGWSLRARGTIVRFDRDLENAKTIATGMRGCCQRLDLASKDGVLYVAENTRYRIVRMDADGKVLSQWGRRSRTDVAGFGACCNPMNVTFRSNGELYTAESGLGRVKRYTADGKFLGLVGEIGVQRFTRAGHLAASCSNITVDVTDDGKLVFVQDVRRNLIRVLQAREPGVTK